MAEQVHEAAAKGEIDTITKLVTDAKNLKFVNEKDNHGETPVLKAVKNEHIEALVVLVAFGADVNIPDKHGKTPIRIAFENKSSVIVHLLCSIGAHVNLSDWSLELQLINTLERHDREMLLMMKMQTEKLSAFQHKLIKSQVVFIESGKSMSIAELGISIETTYHNNIFLRCMQMIPEYADFYLPPNHCFFGDIFEFETWNITNAAIRINLTIPEIPQPNERLSVLPLAGRVRENISLTSIDKLQKLTRLTIDIALKKGKTVKFGVLANEFHEVFVVPKNGTTITPQIEPESYINIKPDTFQTDVQMTVNIAETKMWNEDDHSDKRDFLLTNLMNVTSSVDQQPSKDMEITLPVHTAPTKSMRLTVLVSDKIQPEAESDWKECNPQVFNNDNKVKFQIRAFKWCVAALFEAASAAKRNANKAIKGEKMINVFAMLKKEHTFYELIVEFSLRKRFEENKTQWLTSGYTFQCKKEKYLCRNKPYKISFSGNIEVVQQEDSIPHLIFDMRKDRNFRIFQVKGSEQYSVPTGQVYIGKPVMTQKVPESLLERVLDFFKIKSFNESLITFEDLLFLYIGEKDNGAEEDTGFVAIEYVIYRLRKVDYGYFASLDLSDNSPQRPVRLVYNYVEAQDDPNDVQCSYAVLRRSSLQRLGQLLTEEECTKLRQLLHVSVRQMQAVQNDKNDTKSGGSILCLWRVQTRPNPGMVNILAHALNQIQRGDLADILKTALDRRTEFNYTFQ